MHDVVSWTQITSLLEAENEDINLAELSGNPLVMLSERVYKAFQALDPWALDLGNPANGDSVPWDADVEATGNKLYSVMLPIMQKLNFEDATIFKVRSEMSS